MAEGDWQAWLSRIAAFHAGVLKTGGGGGGTYLFKVHSVIRYGLTADLSLLGVTAEEVVEEDAHRLELSQRDDETVGFEDEPEPDEAREPDLFDDVDAETTNHLDTVELSSKRSSAGAAARRIFLKQRGDPYNRETLIGFPLIGARIGRKKVSGPLFYWSVTPTLDAVKNRLTVTRSSASPALNSVLVSKFTEDDAETELVREQLVPLVQEDPFDLSTVSKAVRQLAAICATLHDVRSLSFEDPQLAAFIEAIRDLSGSESAIVSSIPVLLNSPRSFAFILDDLETLARLREAPGGSVASRFVGPLPEEVEAEEPRGLPFYDTMDAGDPLLFPDQSNDAQRRVGRKARRVRTVTVEGPPGTGKSQTIANVVCDLVATGKTVLVTSHTRKALEVLKGKLPRIPYLAVSVLAGDKESLSKLKSELESVQEAADRNPDELQASVERAEDALRRLDAELRHLDRRFSELRQIESEEFPDQVRLSDIREYDRISPEDRPDYNNSSEVVEGVQAYARLLLRLMPALDQFRSFFEPNGDKTSRAREAQQYELLCELLALFDEIGDERPDESLRYAAALAGEQTLSRELEDKLGGWTEWIRTNGRQLSEELRWIAKHEDRDAGVADLVRIGRELGSVEDVKRFEKEWNGHLHYFQSTPLTGEEAPQRYVARERQEIELALTRVESAIGNPFAWYLSPWTRRARRTLDSANLPLGGRQQARYRLREISAILGWQDRCSACRSLAEGYDHLVPQGLLPPIPSNPTTPRMRRAAGSRVRLIGIIGRLMETPLRGNNNQELDQLGESILERLGDDRSEELAEIVEGVRVRLAQLRRVELVAGSMTVASKWVDHKEQVVRAVEVGDQGLAGPKCVEQLRALADHYSSFRQLKDLAATVLSSLQHTLSELEQEVREHRRIPEWIAKCDVALEAHRLSSLLRHSLSANPDDLGEIADRLAEGQIRRRKIILKIIERRRELGVRRAVRSPVTNNALLNMRDLLGRKRMSQSLLALRDKIEYRELLKVLPCWVCTVDDVARLFPLEAGLFDYVIIDESSQCPQTALLPLAVRARRAIVVGDRKQLQPASARFLSSKAVQVIAERTGITEHPVAQVFDGQKSLLDVAERYREEFDFLDEHFRCDPDIIRWSNDRFYDNRLKVLTHRRNRVFRPALEVRHLKDADDDTERKVNRREADAVVNALEGMVESGDYERMTIGIISPYRKQADLLNELIEERFAGRPNVKETMGLLASTADGFQGDERDVILYSFRYGPSSHPATVHAIEREAERLNVAFTRAKRKAICFVSSPLHRFPPGLIRSFLEHANQAGAGPDGSGRRPDYFDSAFERKVCMALRDRGLIVTTQEPVAGYFIDLVVEDDKGRVLGVECDGQFKFNAFDELRPDDYQRQDVIERAGWTIHRISGRSWLANPEREIDRVVERLRELRTAKDREIATGPRVARDEVEPAETKEAGRVQGPSETSDAATPPVEEPAKEVGTILTQFGETRDEQAQGVKRLNRWFLLYGSLEGSALDALGDIEDKLEVGEALPQSDLEFLEELLYTAFRQGYNPETAENLPEHPALLSDRRGAGAASADAEARLETSDRPWSEDGLSEVEVGILEFLWNSRPGGRDKYQISGHLVSDLGFTSENADPSCVNRLLYGSLTSWVESYGDRPPRWRIKGD